MCAHSIISPKAHAPCSPRMENTPEAAPPRKGGHVPSSPHLAISSGHRVNRGVIVGERLEVGPHWPAVSPTRSYKGSKEGTEQV